MIRTHNEDISARDVQTGEDATIRLTIATSSRIYGPQKIKAAPIVVSAILIYEEHTGGIKDEACKLPKTGSSPEIFTGEESGRRFEANPATEYQFAVQ